MKRKQKFVVLLSLLLSLLLIGFHIVPVFAVSAESRQKPGVAGMVQRVGTPFDASPPDADMPDEPLESESTEDTDGTELTPPGEEKVTQVQTPSNALSPASAAATAELITQGEQPGLYVTLENLPSDVSMIRAQYSFGGLDYTLESKFWEDMSGIEEATGSITLFCYGLDEHPLTAYLSESVNSLYIKIIYNTESAVDGEELMLVISHNQHYELPAAPPPFTADLKLGWFGYTIIGHFTDFLPNVARVSGAYSWDGITYQYSNPDWPSHWDLSKLGKEDPSDRSRLENQETGLSGEEPLVSFLERKEDSFYYRLEITTEDNEVYYSEPAYISRKGTQLLPENLTPRISLGFDLAVLEARNDNGNSEDDEDYYAELVSYTFGEIQLTVRDDATPEEIMQLLPDTVPVRIRLWDKTTKKKYAFGDLSCQVNWKELPSISLKQGKSVVIQDVAEPLVIPAGTEVVTALGTYKLVKPLNFKSRYDSDEIRLVLNPVTALEEPEIGLRAYNYELIDEFGNDSNQTRIEDPMSLAFWNKPNGAHSIQAYAYADGKQWDLGDLLDRRDVNHNLSHALYGYINLLQPDESPYQEYLYGDIQNFTVEIFIKGGVYDGRQVTLTWPQVYELPEEIPDPRGFDGEENNAGSDYEELEDEEDSNGGQRPGLPPEVPSQPAPTADGNASPDNSEWTGPSEQNESIPLPANPKPPIDNPLKEAVPTDSYVQPERPAGEKSSSSQKDSTKAVESASDKQEALDTDTDTDVQPAWNQAESEQKPAQSYAQPSMEPSVEPPADRTPPKSGKLPPGVAAAVGGVFTIAVGGMMISTGSAGKFFAVLRKLFFRK